MVSEQKTLIPDNHKTKATVHNHGSRTRARKKGAKKTYSPYDLNASDNPGNIIT